MLHHRLTLAVKASGLPDTLKASGFHATTGGRAVSILESAGIWLGPRTELEIMEEFRQVIPYVVLQVGDRVVGYTRTSAGGESRLHGKVSIGLGGHVDLSDLYGGADFDLGKTLETTSEREVFEEVGVVNSYERDWIGLIVDNQSAVGRMHIGIVALWKIDARPSRSAEDAIGNLEVEFPRVFGQRERLEPWSSFLIPHLERQPEFAAA